MPVLLSDVNMFLRCQYIYVAGIDIAYGVCSNVPTLAIRRDIDGQQFLKTKKQGAGIGEKKESRGRVRLPPPTPLGGLPAVPFYIYRVPLK